MSPRNAGRAALLTAVAALALPAGAQAAESTSLVTGTAISELSLGVAVPAAMNLTHTAPATTSSLVTVTSTNLAWTLSIADNAGIAGANPGKMLKTAGAVAPAVGTPLANPLQWSSDATTFSNLSGTNATVGTGTLVGTKTVTLRQALGATEAVTAGDIYGLTLKYTAN